MRDSDKSRTEMALRCYFRQQREAVDGEVVDALASMMVAEDMRLRRGERHRLGSPSFVAAQVRYIPIWVWLAQAALVVTMVLVARELGDVLVARWAVGALSAASVLVCIPTLHSSRLHGVVELECSCRNNAASVLVARMIVLGCSAALCVGLMVAVTSWESGLDALSVALWACPPYFLSCSGALAILRRLQPSSALMGCAAWGSLCCGFLYVLGTVFPTTYGEASVTAWALAALASLLWLSREVTLAVRMASKGIDGLIPQTSASLG